MGSKSLHQDMTDTRALLYTLYPQKPAELNKQPKHQTKNSMKENPYMGNQRASSFSASFVRVFWAFLMGRTRSQSAGRSISRAGNALISFLNAVP